MSNTMCDKRNCFAYDKGSCAVLCRKMEPCKFYKTNEQCARQHIKVRARLKSLGYTKEQLKALGYR